jgi:hypothetical protein
MLTLLATILMRDIAPVVGSTMPGADDSAAVRRSTQLSQNSNYILQSTVQDSEQGSLADGSGDAFGD